MSLVCLVAAAASGVLLGVGIRDQPAPLAAPPVDSVDVGFLRDMKVHHAQAVQMSVMVREATDDEQVGTLALDIELTQQNQIGQMAGFLRLWGLPQTSTAPPMRWMADMAMGDGPDSQAGGHDDSSTPTRMPGMATAEELRRLDDLQGRAAERLYLQLMIPHHQAGVDMAQYAAKYASNPEVRSLAARMADSQQAEIDVLKDLLRSRGGPLP